ncbi:MAG: hypothetical protein J7639_13420, partial [Paenibacillaceae bacterium]|nr:hypothetical protein [Paenibacillaceae bacterium]
MRKAVALLAVAVLTTAALAGCSKSKDNNTSAQMTASPAASTASAATTTAKPPAPVTLKINTLYSTIVADNPVMKALTEKTGVTFDMSPVVGDRGQKFDLWLASGDYPDDAMVLQGAYIAKYREAGAIIPVS